MAGRMKSKPETSWTTLLSEVAVYKRPPKALEVTIVCGNHMPKMDRTGLCDPVIQFKVDDGQSISKINPESAVISKKKRMLASELETSVAKQTLNPIWDEKFMVSLADEENPGRLTLAVHDYDIDVMKLEYIGEVRVTCEKVEEWLNEEVGYEFSGSFIIMKRGEVVIGEDNCTSTIDLKIKIVVDTINEERLKEESQNALKIMADAATDEPLVEGELLKAGNTEFGKFRSRIVRLTNTYISYHVLAEAPAIDRIMFEDIVGVVWRSSDGNELEFCFRPGGDLNWEKARAATLALEATDFAVCSSRVGAHRGRQYQFRTSTMLQREQWLVSIGRILQRHFDKPVMPLNDLQRSRRIVRWFYMGDRCQICVACLIMLNFALNIIEANFPNVDPGSALDTAFNQADFAFTAIFTIELSVNLFATLFREFFFDYWNWFDVSVVVVSLLSFSMQNLPGASALRLMRCLRVFRLFKRVPSLRQIVVSLSASIPSMLNALFIVLLMTSIYAIIAVNFFGNLRPDLFGDFFGGLFTMFQVLTGDAWSDVARSLFDLTGNPAATGAFFVSYMLTIALVLINVVVAVLLDEFGKAADAPSAHNRTDVGGTDVFDRIAYVFTSYRDNEELQTKITALFRRLVELVKGARNHSQANLNLQFPEGSSDLDSEVFSFESMQKGLKQLGLIPPILFQRSDWELHIEKKGLAHVRDSDLEMVIGLPGFQIMMKNVVRSYNIRMLNNVLQTGHLNSLGDENVKYIFQGIKSLAIVDQSVSDKAMKTKSRFNLKQIEVGKLTKQLKAIQLRLSSLERDLMLANQAKSTLSVDAYDTNQRSFVLRKHIGQLPGAEGDQEISNIGDMAGPGIDAAASVPTTGTDGTVIELGAHRTVAQNGHHSDPTPGTVYAASVTRKGNIGSEFTPIFASPLAPFQKLGESCPPFTMPGNNSGAAFGVTAPAVGWSLWGAATPAPATQSSIARLGNASTGAVTRRVNPADNVTSSVMSPFGWNLWGGENATAPTRHPVHPAKESTPLGTIQEGVSHMFSGFLGGLTGLGVAASGPKRFEPASSLSRRHGLEGRDRRISILENPTRE